MSMGRTFRTLLQEKRFITSFGIAMPLYKDLEAKYLPAEEGRKKYDGAIGL
jgi:hypothetical protein